VILPRRVDIPNLTEIASLYKKKYIRKLQSDLLKYKISLITDYRNSKYTFSRCIRFVQFL